MTKAKKFAEIRSESGEVLVQCFSPGADDDVLSVCLRILTHQLSLLPDVEKSGGCFGGDFGYGAAFENETFLMHPFCWCERYDCPWCGGCACSTNEYAVETDPSGTPCAWCRNEHRWEDKGALRPDEWPHDTAPHFWFKPTGLRVWWYKYIGRDNQVWPQGESFNPGEIFTACLASIGGPTLDAAFEAYQAAEEEAAKASRRSLEWMMSDEGRAAMDRMMGDSVIQMRTFGFGADAQ